MLCCRAPPALVVHLRRSRVQASARVSQARRWSSDALSPGGALTRSPQVCMAQSSGVVKTYKLDASSEGCTGRRHGLTPPRSAWLTQIQAFSTASATRPAIFRPTAIRTGRATAGRSRRGASTRLPGVQLELVYWTDAAPQGVEAEPGWVQVVDAPDKWLPVSGHGHTYLWEQK